MTQLDFTEPPESPSEPDELATEEIVQLDRAGRKRIGLLLKRTYVIVPGRRCVLADEAMQEVLVPIDVAYDDVAPPAVSPVQFGDDSPALKDATDVIVQGTAYSYRAGTRRSMIRVAFNDVQREIAVFGDRRGEWIRGRAHFGEPDTFAAIPMRYDRAYGGFDALARERYGFPGADAIAFARPDWAIETLTPYHYPRNPCGRGYLLDLDQEGFDGMALPNFEYPFDPLSPKRLAVKDTTRWILAPMPAGIDWQGSGCFPRSAYLGYTPTYEGLRGAPAEVTAGWAPSDLLDTPPIHRVPQLPVRREYARAASPGMSVPELSPDTWFELTNLHPDEPLLRLQLPGEAPDAELALSPHSLTSLAPFLNTVVIRPDVSEVVMVWFASAKADRRYAPDELRTMGRVVNWRSA